MINSKVNWLNHEFTVLKHDAGWNDVSGIYIFAGLNSQNQWVPLYVGQAGSFKDRLPQHEQWEPSVKLGATHVHAKLVPKQDDRNNLEQILIKKYQPKLNTQLK